MHNFTKPTSNGNPFGNFNPITTNNMPTNKGSHNFNSAYQINTPFIEKADFRNALSYSIDPSANRIKNAQFSESGIAGLLDSFKIRIE